MSDLLDALLEAAPVVTKPKSIEWKPELTADPTGSDEVDRQEVHNGGVHVGYVVQRGRYAPSDYQWVARAINGDEVGGRHGSQQAALDALRRHLETAEKRILKLGGRWLVARPSSYGGPTTYTEYPSQDTARHAAGLPPSGGSIREAETGKPGTNFKQVGPRERKKVEPLVAHYRKQAHPFAACVRDNRKRFPEPGRAEKVCAVLKDMGEGSTKWHGKGKGKITEDDIVLEAIAAVATIDSTLGEGAALRLANGELAESEDDNTRRLEEHAFDAYSKLFLCGILGLDGSKFEGDAQPAPSTSRRVVTPVRDTLLARR